MKSNICIFFFLLILTPISPFAQRLPLLPLEIGDKVPDVTLTNVRNYRTSTIQLSEFKGKLIILDFWDKWCNVCINAFPKMEKLQNQFGNRIQILLVARNKEDELKRLFQTSPILKSTKLPIIIGDTVLHQLFPHTAVPYHVWLDGNGVVKARSMATVTTAGNIKAFLTNGDITLPLRNDVLDMAVVKSPLLEQLYMVPEQRDQVVFYSLLIKRSKVTPQHNKPIIDLFRNAYESGRKIEKVLVEPRKTENLSKYYKPINKDKWGEWEEQNTFQYEIGPQKVTWQLQPDSALALRNKFMQQDLERYFGVHAILEKRKVKCWVLQSLNPNINSSSLKSAGGEKISEPIDDHHYILRNIPFRAIPNLIQICAKDAIGEKDAPIIINEVKFSGPIDVDLKLSADLKTLNNTLAGYGLFIQEEIRELNCLVLKEI